MKNVLIRYLLISAFKHLRKSPEEETLEYYEMPLNYGVQ